MCLPRSWLMPFGLVISRDESKSHKVLLSSKVTSRPVSKLKEPSFKRRKSTALLEASLWSIVHVRSKMCHKSMQFFNDVSSHMKKGKCWMRKDILLFNIIIYEQDGIKMSESKITNEGKESSTKQQKISRNWNVSLMCYWKVLMDILLLPFLYSYLYFQKKIEIEMKRRKEGENYYTVHYHFFFLPSLLIYIFHAVLLFNERRKMISEGPLPKTTNHDIL